MSLRNLRRNINIIIEFANEEHWMATLVLGKDSAANDIRASILAEIERADLMESSDDGAPKYRVYVKTTQSSETPIDNFFHAAMGTSVETFAREMENSSSNPLRILVRDYNTDDDDKNDRDECVGGTSTVYRRRGVLACAFREKLRSWFNLHQKRIIVTDKSKSIERQKAVIDRWKGSEPDLLRRSFTMSGFGMICNEFIRFFGNYSDAFQKFAEVIPNYRILSRASIPTTPINVNDLSRLRLLLESARNQDGKMCSKLIKVLLGDEKPLNVAQSASTDGDETEPSSLGSVDSDNESEHPERPRASANLRVPTDASLRAAFEDIMVTIVAFRHNKVSKPESTLVSLLWSRIFRAALIDTSFNILSDGTEFEIHSMLDASNGVKLYADYVAWLTSQTGNILPIFFVESAAEFMSASCEEKDHFHKDYRKLALSMLVSLLRFVGIFRNHPQLLQEIRVYGAFTAGTQIQFCVAYPVYCSGSLSVIFDTRPEWRFDICVQSSVEPTDAFRVDGADLSAVNLLDVPLPEFDSEEAVSEGRWECGDLLNSLNQTIAPDPSSPAKPEKCPDCCHISDIQSLNDQVLNIMAFFKDVQKTAKTISGGLSSDRLGPPIPLPSEFQSSFSSGSAKNNSVSPQKTSTPQKTASRTTAKSGKQIFMGVNVTEVVRKNMTNTAVVPNSSLDDAVNQYRVIVKPGQFSTECQILRRLIGQRNIVQLAHWESFDGLPAYAMVQEDLIQCPIEMNKHGCAGLMSTRSSLLLDAMAALNSLHLFKIIHRDFSVNNFMFSQRDRCWKLIDFNLAVDADENGLFVSDEKTACGTKHHQAPELLHPERYELVNLHLDTLNEGASNSSKWYIIQSVNNTVRLKRHDSAINVQDVDVVSGKRLRDEPIPAKIIYSYASDLFAAVRAVLHHRFQYYMEFMTSFEEEEDPVAIRIFNQQQQLLAQFALNDDPYSRHHPKVLYDELLDMHAELYHHFHECAPDYQRSPNDHLVMFRTIS